MSKFAKYRVHFDTGTGKICAHSDPIRVDEIEEWIEDLGGRVKSFHDGNLYWFADPNGEDENSVRLAREWLADPIANEYPAKAFVLRKMVDEDNPD